MGAKSKYVIVQIASVISGTTKIWIRDRAAEKAMAICFDPAIGRKVLFEEVQKVKGKATLDKRIKEMYNIAD
uniref:Uncharacterized protein n=2 Tax=Panagrolaimus sp. ES5 TaxID=591445 RepID=A0AC34FX01_9BILA